MGASDYAGQSMAIHVHADGPTGPITPAGPIDSGPTYQGQLPLNVKATSPAGLDEDSLFGPIWDEPQIHGRSAAIHVFGAPYVWVPFPIPSCECSGEAGEAHSGTFETFSRSVVGGFGTSEFVGTPVWGIISKAFGDETADVNGSAADVSAAYTSVSAHFAESKIDVRSNTGAWSLPLEVVADWQCDGIQTTSTRRAFLRITIGGHVFEMLVQNTTGGATIFSDGAQLGPDITQLGARVFTGGAHYDATGEHGEFFPYRSPWNTPLRLRVRIESLGGGVLKYRTKMGFADEDPAWSDTSAAGTVTDDDMTLRLTPFRNPTTAVTRHVTVDTLTILEGIPGIPTGGTCPPDLDTFNRNTADYVLGSTTPGGKPWTINPATQDVFFGVQAYVGTPPSYVPADVVGSLFTAAEAGSPTLLATLQSGGELWESSQGFVMTGIFSIYNAPGTFIDSRVHFRLLDGFGIAYGEMVFRIDNRLPGQFGSTEGGYVRLENNTQIQKVNWITEAGGLAYFWKWERIPGQISRIKLWTTDQPEPSDWLVTAPAVDVPFIPIGGFLQLRVDPGIASGGDADGINFYRLSFSGQCCTECDGFLAFTPNYLPIFRRQIGDPTTDLDSFICTMESAAMVLDWETRGAVQVWGGELIPWTGRSIPSIVASGTNLGDAAQAWSHFGRHLQVRSGQTFADLLQCIAEGRAVIMQGHYGVLAGRDRCQANFTGDHAVCLMPFVENNRILQGDPLCSTWHSRDIGVLQLYAETLGVAVFGVTSPQKILFAVSSPWIQ